MGGPAVRPLATGSRRDDRPSRRRHAAQRRATATDGGVRRPVARLAEAAGYDDTERWWEDMIEHRGEGEPWDAIIEAIAELRATPEPPRQCPPGTEAQREASMRQHIRAAEKQHERVAVVCGAWHAPVLVERGPAKPDRELLAGLPRERATVTWVPWTYTRLAFASGYGAGVTSPGWYEHLYVSPDRPIERWMVKVASPLRRTRRCPPRLCHRRRPAGRRPGHYEQPPLAGLSECTDAVRAILSGGNDQVLGLVARLVVGDVIGEVPPSTYGGRRRRSGGRAAAPAIETGSDAQAGRPGPAQGDRPRTQPLAPPPQPPGCPLGRGTRRSGAPARSVRPGRWGGSRSWP